MARNILQRLIEKQLTKAATRGGSKKLSKGLPYESVREILNAAYSMDVPTELNTALLNKIVARIGRAEDQLKPHMPVEVSLPPTLPHMNEARGVYSLRDYGNKLAVDYLAGWLSTLSRMPQELFSRAGKVKFDFGPGTMPPDERVAARFRHLPEGNPWRGVEVLNVATKPWNLQSASWTLAHEAGHSLADKPELYEKILDFLEAAEWRFPAGIHNVEQLRTSGIDRNPLRALWLRGRINAPRQYEDLSDMFYPDWPEFGSPLHNAPSWWALVQRGSGIAPYAETHPVEDIAESVAARVMESYPELADVRESVPSPLRDTLAPPRWLGRSMMENVRYEPITEFLKAAGVPLSWLLLLLQRRRGQEEVS